MFWDKLRPGQKEPGAVAVEVTDEGIIAVRWDDDKVSPIPSRRLRLDCPCASCIDEWTGAKLLDPSRIPEEIRRVAMEPSATMRSRSGGPTVMRPVCSPGGSSAPTSLERSPGRTVGGRRDRELLDPPQMSPPLWTNRGRQVEPEAT